MILTKTLSVTFALLLGPCCYGQTSPCPPSDMPKSSSPVFSISVDPPSAPIHLAGPMNITVTVTNVTDKEIYWDSDRGKDTVYKAFEIGLMKDGHEAETTFFHRRITGRQRADDPMEVESGSSIALPHPPGKMFVMTIDLKRLYEIREPGLYTLDLSRFDDYSLTTVRAKPLTLNIVP
jgi:hypothetical protein